MALDLVDISIDTIAFGKALHSGVIVLV